VEKLCSATGLALNGTTSLELQRLLERVASRGNDVLAMVVRQQVVGCRVSGVRCGGWGVGFIARQRFSFEGAVRAGRMQSTQRMPTLEEGNGQDLI
jgi:hypothetical protein